MAATKGRAVAVLKEHIQPKYRADIDGLRAVAVLLVVLNHLHFKYLLGGYIGVDVFFVISGYLIGSSLIDDYHAGSLSLAGFYERRARRILPALLAMLIGSSLLAYLYFLPQALISYCHSLIAALFSYSNFFFSEKVSYFDTARINYALLHTWSLGVEEQFYIVLPLMLLLILRWKPRYLRIALWLAMLSSLGGAVWMTGLDAKVGFYFSPFRAWELFAGVLISQYSLTMLRSRLLRETAAATGALLIGYASLSYTQTVLFRAWTTFLPCLGAVLLLAAGKVDSTAMGSALSTKPMTFLGRISYSLYLWHWPIFVFLSSSGLVVGQDREHLRAKLFALALSIVIAILSWWLIETPFRKKPFVGTRQVFFMTAGTAFVVLLVLAVATFHYGGFSGRFPAEVVRVGEFQGDRVSDQYRSGQCFLLPANSIHDFSVDHCLAGVAGKKQYLILGDSTAAHLYSGLVHVFPQIQFLQATVAECAPLRSVSMVSSPGASNCADLSRLIFKEYVPTHHPDAVILGGVWSSKSIVELNSTLFALQQAGIKPILMGPPFEFDAPLPLLLAMDMQRHPLDTNRSERLRHHLKWESLALDKEMRKQAKEVWHVSYISYYDDLCPPKLPVGALAAPQDFEQGCPLMTRAGEPLLIDNHHLSRSGSELFAKRMQQKGELP